MEDRLRRELLSRIALRLLGSPVGLDKGINEVKGWVVRFFFGFWFLFLFFLLSKEEGKGQQFIDESL